MSSQAFVSLSTISGILLVKREYLPPNEKSRGFACFVFTLLYTFSHPLLIVVGHQGVKKESKARMLDMKYLLCEKERQKVQVQLSC